MSGFGGFGAAPAPSFGSFGNNPQQQHQQGFGAPPPAFAQPQQQQQQPLFGSAAAPPANNPPAFGAPSSFLGASTPAPTFGAPASGGFGATTSGGGFAAAAPSSSNTMFGQSSTTTPFGQQSSTTSGGFGSGQFSASTTASTTMAPFGSGGAATTTQQQPPFGTPQPPPTTKNQPFGTSSTIATSNNPFGAPSSAAAAPVPSLSFGMSSNLAPPPTSSMGGGGGFAAASSGSNTGFGVASSTNSGYAASSTVTGFGTATPTSNTPFGGAGGTSLSPPSSGPFGSSTTTAGSTAFGTSSGGLAFAAPASFTTQQQQDDDDDGMADADDDNAPPAPSSLPFGQPFGGATASATSSNNTTHSAVTWTRSNAVSNATSTAASPFGDGPAAASAGAAAQAKSEMEEKLAKMKAKLAEKVRKREEKKKREEETASNKKNEAPALRADAPAFLPSSSAAAPSSASASLAQRNAERFATSKDTDTRSQLPADLLSQSTAAAAANSNALRNAGGRADRENLENAVSLIGVCEYMCPDEELLRRERESDIQLLERPVPDGRFHPAHWTLRDTMVKRFRRSAADYKLDVPEWVRPPDVLERVCGYLEEWVMERDRQGADPRYKGVAPPPLDVYQFIWDRTRMVRKDFILQNYVGAGGLCDARAVRCHERIARWHCMCEHQLSHIPDFVTMQSQQNIQELGQTMKTLNQYYDDPMNRSLVEVPDELGRETRTDLSAINFGCQSDIVQGTNPVDFDGSALSNTADTINAAIRLIGKHGVGSPHHGTAEPEMRGLYILLTIGNDGGMEVLKYAGRLYQKRPEIYHTAPVQLALSICKAKNDLNYARFFSILRSDSTPYLFACLMFKHVEYMRKYALYIMSKAYGGRSKENEGLYDSYPLQRLTNLLCYEDDDEARAACKHYGIFCGTLNDMEGGEPTVYWKRGRFREPKDPEKGTAIPLRPRKMVKVIEQKLNGATRLAICRGEVGGEESVLSASQAQARRDSVRGNVPSAEQQRARAEALYELKKKEEQRKQKQRAEAEARRREEEAKRKEAEQLQLAEQERKRKLEEQKRQAQLKEEREQKNRDEREKKLLEQKRRELEAAQERERAKQKAQEEERQRQLELKRQEALRHQEMERLRAEQERKRREEEERKRQEALRQEEERKRLELLRQQEDERKRLEQERLRREEERKRREAEAYRLQQELKKRVESAQKTLLWRRLVSKTKLQVAADKTKESLLRLKGLPFAYPSSSRRNFIHTIPETQHSDHRKLGIRRILERSLQSDDSTTDLGNRFAENIRFALEENQLPTTTAPTEARTFLFKIAVFLPPANNTRDAGMSGLVRSWLKSRLDFGRVFFSESSLVKVRLVVVDMSAQYGASICDAALLVIPPPWSNSSSQVHNIEELKVLGSELDKDVPRALLVISESFESSNTENERLIQILSPDSSDTRIARNSDLSLSAVDRALSRSTDSLAKMFQNTIPRSIERISMDCVFYKCMSTLIWSEGFIDTWENLANTARSVILTFVDAIDSACADYRRSGPGWPTPEFAVDGKIPNYFGTGIDLPVDWASSTSRTYVGGILNQFADRLRGQLSEVIQLLVDDAPSEIRRECESLFDSRFYKRCLQRALAWRVRAGEAAQQCLYLYLPPGFIDEAAQYAVASQQLDSVKPQDQPFTFIIDDDSTEEANSPAPSGPETPLPGGDAFAEEIDLPPHETPLQDIIQSPSAKRPWTDPGNEAFAPLLLEDVPGSPQTTNKRRRRAESKPSKEISESMSFTKKLERLLNGSETKDMMIASFDGGSSLLSAALRGAPPLSPLD